MVSLSGCGLMTTIVLSDLHLGARNSQTDCLAALLDSDFDRLVLNGDTVDSLNLRRFRQSDWRVVEQLRAVSRERELVLVRGNHDGTTTAAHDFGCLDVLAEVLGATPREEYELELPGGRYLVLHGDQFDHTLNLTWLGDLADWGYRQIQLGSQRFAAWLKRRVKRWGSVDECVRVGALARARQRGYTGVITGHTHYRHDEWLDGMHYLNTGCWVDLPCSYVLVEGGSARVVDWPQKPCARLVSIHSASACA
jgi:UDP-2,3-diacylglucosamine pyrophosphatase LpxH